MKSDHRYSLAVLLPAAATMLAALFALVFPAATRADQSAPPRVAIANTARIFSDMQETKDLKAKLEGKRKDIETEENDRRSKINAMEAGLKEMNPGNAQFNAAQDAMDKEMADFDSWGKLVRLQAEREQKNTMILLFNKIQSAVGKIAAQDGIDIVLADQAPDLSNTEGMTFDQLRSVINQKQVLYTSKKADISDEVLTLLDAEYAKDKAAGK
jgi:Skp family chaperone for outer membrane proteins